LTVGIKELGSEKKRGKSKFFMTKGELIRIIPYTREKVGKREEKKRKRKGKGIRTSKEAGKRNKPSLKGHLCPYRESFFRIKKSFENERRKRGVKMSASWERTVQKG